jgi:hypothetical protein
MAKGSIASDPDAIILTTTLRSIKWFDLIKFQKKNNIIIGAITRGEWYAYIEVIAIIIPSIGNRLLLSFKNKAIASHNSALPKLASYPILEKCIAHGAKLIANPATTAEDLLFVR